MSVLDVLAWVFIVPGTVIIVYTVAMLATGPARTRRVGGAHARVGLTGPGASREAYEAISGAVVAIASGVIVLTIDWTSHVRWLLVLPAFTVVVIDVIQRYRNRQRAKAQPS
jgi:hypothetical protein